MNDNILIEQVENCGVNYYVYYIFSNKNRGYNFGYLLAIPYDLKDNTRLIVEPNILESSNNNNKLIRSGLEILQSLGKIFPNKKIPAIVPLFQGVKGITYFQKLPDECFDKQLDEKYKRIDLQVIKMIEDAKVRIFQMTGKSISDKIFLKGYSSSGVFAERFALLQPDIINSLCVGCGDCSISVPMSQINENELFYPIGTNDIKKIIGKNFDEESYQKIKFFYYIYETEELTTLDRFKKITETYKSLGYDITTHVYPVVYNNRGQTRLEERANQDIFNFYNNNEFKPENLVKI